MTGNTVESLETFENPSKTNELRRFIRVFFGRKVVTVGFIIILVMLFIAIFAPFIAPHDPFRQNLSASLQAPSAVNLLGTDFLGRDLLSRIIYGSRISLAVGIVSVLLAGGIGIALGLISGFFGGFIDNLIMRFIDALMAIPPLMLAIAVRAVLGGGITNVILALAISLIPTYARVMRGQVLAVKQADYIMAAEIVGGSNLRIMLAHVLPNCLSPLIVLATLNLGFAILAEAALSFLGMGIMPPTPAWGAMVNDGYRFLLTNPILSFAPGFCVMLVVLAFNLVGDGLRDSLDPRLRGTI